MQFLVSLVLELHLTVILYLVTEQRGCGLNDAVVTRVDYFYYFQNECDRVTSKGSPTPAACADPVCEQIKCW